MNPFSTENPDQDTQPMRPQPGFPAPQPGYPPTTPAGPWPQPAYPPAQPGGPWPQPDQQPPPPPPAYFPVERQPGRRRRSTGRGRRPRASFGCSGCLPLLGLLVVSLVCLGAYLLAPLRTNFLVMGIDYTPPGSSVGRSDTLILATANPLRPYIGMLSIPRDLWVTIPGYGENRINTAHFFGEAAQAGAGPRLALDTIRQNFGVDVGNYVRIRFEGFRDVIDAMGGLDIELDQPAAGYAPGRYHLTGRKALAFARQRLGSDDFFRMEHGQILIKAAIRQMMNPLKWPRLPAVLFALGKAVDTNLPVYQWPRIGFALLRLGAGGIDNRTIRREMVTPFQTSEGADVLLPNWDAINPVLLEMFGQ